MLWQVMVGMGSLSPVLIWDLVGPARSKGVWAAVRPAAGGGGKSFSTPLLINIDQNSNSILRAVVCKAAPSSGLQEKIDWNINALLCIIYNCSYLIMAEIFHFQVPKHIILYFLLLSILFSLLQPSQLSISPYTTNLCTGNTLPGSVLLANLVSTLPN